MAKIKKAKKNMPKRDNRQLDFMDVVKMAERVTRVYGRVEQLKLKEV